ITLRPLEQRALGAASAPLLRPNTTPKWTLWYMPWQPHIAIVPVTLLALQSDGGMHMSNQTVSNVEPHVLADTLTKLFEAMPKQEANVFLTTQRLLLSGRPVAPAQIAARLQLPQETVTALLHQFGVEWDAHGNVLGFGLSLTPTPH